MYILGSDGAWYNADFFIMIVPVADGPGYACHMDPLDSEHVTVRITDDDAVKTLEKMLGIYRPALASRNAA
jgi:hypothetical protein